MNIGNIHGSSIQAGIPVVRRAPDAASALWVRKWTRRVCWRMGLPGLPLVVSFTFTNTLPFGVQDDTEVLGRTTPRGGIVRLSLRAWRRMTRREQHRLVVHELCHIVEIIQYGRLSWHGALFGRLMKKAGVKPNRLDLAARDAA